MAVTSITDDYPGRTESDVTEIQKALLSLGADIAPDELFTATTAGTYGRKLERR